MDKARCTAIILAAGQGSRMGTKTPKQYLELQGEPIIYYTIQAFQDSDIIDEIVLVTGCGQTEYVCREIVDKYCFSKVCNIVEGGEERYHSVWEGLKMIDDPDGYVFVHDGVRCLVDGEIIGRAYEAVQKYRACTVGMPVKDTIKIADSEGFVGTTPDRKLMWQIQTPQVFETGIIKKAYELLMKEVDIQVTDDSMVVENMLKIPVKLVEGKYENIKITTPDDLYLAELFLV